MADERDLWPSPPPCPHCEAVQSTEVVKPMEGGRWLMTCASCARPTVLDRHGQILQRADDVRG